MVKTIVHELRDAFTAAIGSAFPEIEEKAEVTESRREGDYQCNSAMRLAKKVGKNPREVAVNIVDAFDCEAVERLEVAGPGFINAYLRVDAIEERLGAPIDKVEPQRVIVEYSSPNTAKEMHVGHLRSTIIGECLARVLEFLGHDVLRLNHVGDWGTSFGMLIAYIKEHKPSVLGAEEVDLSQLVAFYKAAKRQFDADPAFKKRAQLEVVALQGGDPAALKAWKKVCAVSRSAYQEIYDLLDVRIEERGESYYNPMLLAIVEELENKGLITVNDGAKCVFLEGFTNREGEPLPQIVEKSDGGYNYSTTDLAALRHRVKEEKAEWIIYVVDLGQKTHFDMVFETAKKAGFVDDSVRLNHAAFGLVLGSDGKKFRTRSGETEKLIDLLEAAIAHARSILVERIEGDVDELARTLGIAAVKYADLSCSRTSDYMFSYDKMLSLDGNTAAFLLYSYVRVKSIKRKVGEAKPGKIVLKHPSEVALGLHLVRFHEAVEAVARELLPNRLCDYLYGLAQKFNAFFRDCHVQGTPEQNERLLLCEEVSKTMERGLKLLGIGTIDRM